MKKILILFFLVPILLYSQNKKRALGAYKKAVEYYKKKEDYKAKKFAEQAIRQDSTFLDSYLLLGQLSEDANNLNEAIFFYLKGISDDNEKKAWGYYKVANLEFAKGKYEEAKNHFEYFLKFENQNKKFILDSRRKLKNCDFAIYSIKNSFLFKPVNMGEAINTKWKEYLPSISADGNLFIFTRKAPHYNSIYSEDFFSSTYKDGKWILAKNLGPNINTYGNEGAQCLTSDGSVLFFTACDREDGYGGCDIYLSYLTENGWSDAKNLGPNINTKYWETQPSISADGKHIYFVSNRPGGVGGKDIYVSCLQEDGLFSKPNNIGSNINTKYDEMSPFIHIDNQTLYFASKGHVGMGDFDLFMSRKDLNSQKWGSPQNLGFPINTYDVENSLVVSSDGKTAYFTSNKSGFGEEDIFYFELPDELQAKEINELEIDMLTQEKGKEIVLENVHFEHNSYELLDTSLEELDNLKDYLFKYPDLKIELQGHTDNIGSVEENKELSKNRAKVVYEYLISVGINEKRLNYIGFGESSPISSNKTEQGRSNNRRTSFLIK
tara:strand:+ start:1224 stop:2873 length:1650 start_codon:yes stop_codon:yes gene_type:complete